MSVLLFHLGVNHFQGGYIGVDVFFVISGFLITRLIRGQIRADTFSFRRFYIRRARRLFPAILCTVAATLVVAAFVFPPRQLATFGRSVPFTLLSLSNFLFWKESNYFGSATGVKPLLHTWSLSVEEQFYLLWPLMLFLLLRYTKKWSPPVLLALGGAVSLYLNQVFLAGPPPWLTEIAPKLAAKFSDGSSTIFYLAPFRVFEFSIGAVLVWFEGHEPKKSLWLELLALLGLGLIAYPVLTFSEATVFPSYNALMPCVGTALLIFAGRAPYTGRLLSHPVCVGIGLLSYSLYLVHWPIIVFVRFAAIPELSAASQLGLGMACFVAAYALYRLVETPFRHPRPGASSAKFVYGGIAIAMLLAVPGANAYSSGGWHWRLPEEMESMSLRLDEGHRGYLQGASYCHHDTNGGLPADLGERCLSRAPNKVNVLLFGDSHAAMVMSGLRENYPNVHFSQLTSGWCRPSNRHFGRDANAQHTCPHLHDRFWQEIDRGGFDAVIATARWTFAPELNTEIDQLQTMAEKLETRDIPLFILGPAPELIVSNSTLVAQSADLRHFRSAQQKVLDPRSFSAEALFRKRSDGASWRYLSIIDTLCPQGRIDACDFVLPGNLPHSHDNAHLTHWGSQHVVAALKASQGLRFTTSQP